MKTKTYLILCTGITVVLFVSLLYIPAFSDAVEQVVLAFLATNAR
ncbi:MAG: hypothetical protein ACI9CE_002042 [Flavobacterium sp.]|jgi:hypothetical protein